jgi:hypothetical protein
MVGADETSAIRLSKSKLAAYEHCPKRLWLQVHRRDQAQFDETTLARFRFGHDVGNRARLLVPGGVLVDTGWDMDAAIARTSELIATSDRRPIFEGTFVHANVLVRVDILQPIDDGWEAIEVKASTGARSYHLADLATQVWVMRGTGLPIGKATIRHLGRRVSWWRPDHSAVTFRDADVTQVIGRYLSERSRIAEAAQHVACTNVEPTRPMGMHCYKPLACEFRAHCSRWLAT